MSVNIARKNNNILIIIYIDDWYRIKLRNQNITFSTEEDLSSGENSPLAEACMPTLVPNSMSLCACWMDSWEPLLVESYRKIYSEPSLSCYWVVWHSKSLEGCRDYLSSSSCMNCSPIYLFSISTTCKDYFSGFSIRPYHDICTTHVLVQFYSILVPFSLVVCKICPLYWS